MRDNQYTTEGRIRFSEVDHTRRITLPGIVNYFQAVSYTHLDVYKRQVEGSIQVHPDGYLSFLLSVKFLLESGHHWF